MKGKVRLVQNMSSVVCPLKTCKNYSDYEIKLHEFINSKIVNILNILKLGVRENERRDLYLLGNLPNSYLDVRIFIVKPCKKFSINIFNIFNFFICNVSV